MAVELERMIATLEANFSKYDRSLNKALGSTDKTFTKIERRGKEMESKLGGLLKNFGTGLLAGVAAGGVAGIVGQFREVARSVAEIGNEAKRAGVTTQVFQEWKAVAAQARIPVDALVDGFKELNIRADEFATTGKGSAAEAFARLGLTPEETKARIKDPAEFMLLLIDRTRQLKDTAAATRIFDELFGGTGAEKLVTLLDQSTDSIRATIDQAHTLGNVLDDDVIARAAELDRQFTIISQTVGTALRGAIVSAATALQDFINAFNGFEAQRGEALDQKLATLGRERLDIEKQIADIRARGDGLAGDGIFGTSLGDSGALGGIADQQRRMEAIAAEEEMILKVLEGRRKLAETPPAEPFTPAPYTPPASTGGTGGRTRRDGGAASADREAEAVRKLIAELERELELVGATDLERETANALRQAGASATEEQRAKIIALVAALEAEETALQNATDAAEELANIGRDVLGGIIGDLREGKSAADILANALERVGDRLLNIGLDSLFGGAGGGDLLGSLLSLNLRRSQ